MGIEIECKDKNSSWDLIGLCSPMVVAFGQQYNIEEKIIVIHYTYIKDRLLAIARRSLMDRIVTIVSLTHVLVTCVVGVWLVQQNPLCVASCVRKDLPVSPRFSRTIFYRNANSVLLSTPFYSRRFYDQNPVF